MTYYRWLTLSVKMYLLKIKFFFLDLHPHLHGESATLVLHPKFFAYYVSTHLIFISITLLTTTESFLRTFTIWRICNSTQYSLKFLHNTCHHSTILFCTYSFLILSFIVTPHIPILTLSFPLYYFDFFTFRIIIQHPRHSFFLNDSSQNFSRNTRTINLFF